MPTKNRRLMITPSAELWEILDKFHHLTGRARASIAVEFMQTVANQMAEIADILENVRKLESDALADVAQASEVAFKRMCGAVAESEGAMHALGAAVAGKPPSSNTGVTDPLKGSAPSRRKAA